MNRFLKAWRLSGCGEAFGAYVVAYASDGGGGGGRGGGGGGRAARGGGGGGEGGGGRFVILSRGCAAEALAWTRAAMTKLGLTLNEAKTSLKDASTEGFDFLGYTFGPHHRTKDGRLYTGASPSKKSVARIKAKVGDMLTPANMAPWPKVRQKLNRLLLGWSAYFSYGSLAKAYRDVDHYVVDHVRAFLARRHKMQNRGARSFSRSYIYGKLEVASLWKHHPNPAPRALP